MSLCCCSSGSHNTGEEQVFALMAEFDNVDDLISGADTLRRAGYTRIDAHSPFPVHGIDEALGIKPTILPWLVLFMGLLGLTTAIFLTTYTMSNWANLPGWLPVQENIRGYEFSISGKPLLAIPAYFPVMFEMTIMFAAYTAVFAMFLLNRLPRLHNPLFKSRRFLRATQDKFFLVAEAEDPKFNADTTHAQLSGLRGVTSVETITD